jgi:hypothetical protein
MLEKSFWKIIVLVEGQARGSAYVGMECRRSLALPSALVVSACGIEG